MALDLVAIDATEETVGERNAYDGIVETVLKARRLQLQPLLREGATIEGDAGLVGQQILRAQQRIGVETVERTTVEFAERGKTRAFAH